MEFYLCFMFFWLSLAYIWIFDRNKFRNDISIFYQFFVETDFEFYIIHLKKNYKKEIHKRVKIALFFLLLFLIAQSDKLTLRMFVGALILSVIIYKLQYIVIKKQYQKLVMEADSRFPYYLNNLCLLIQDNAIPVALLKSIESAPDVFKTDLEILVNELHEGEKRGLLPYLEFYNKFPQVKDLNRIVKTLYNISIASSQKNKMILSLTKLTNEKVTQARQQTFNETLDKQALIPWISFVWVGIVLITSFSAINIGSILS